VTDPVRRRAMMRETAEKLWSSLFTSASKRDKPPPRAAPIRTADGERLRLDALRLVSLSHVHDPETTTLFPGDPPFELETVATIRDDGYYLQRVRSGEHTGTHWGAPGHFHEGAALADELEPRDLFLPAVKIDARHQCSQNPDYALTVNDIKVWESKHGKIPDQSLVILWTGWDEKWGTPAFANVDAAGVKHQPGFSVDALHWLIDTGRIGYNGGTGIDTFGPDLGRDDSYAVSRLVYQEHRVSLEVLANLIDLPAAGAYVLCGGQINKRGSGSSALIYGIIPPGRA
jgi:kynurenine formamidase